LTTGWLAEFAEVPYQIYDAPLRKKR